MSHQAPKFLLNGINAKYNFMGKRTSQTAFYGIIEVGIKTLPLLFLIYGSKHLTTFHTPERDEFLDESKADSKQESTRRLSFD